MKITRLEKKNHCTLFNINTEQYINEIPTTNSGELVYSVYKQAEYGDTVVHI